MSSPVRPGSSAPWAPQAPAGPSAGGIAGPEAAAPAHDPAAAPHAPRTGTTSAAGAASAAPRQGTARWTLGGVDLHPSAVASLQQLARVADPSERPAWEAALAALQGDRFQAHAGHQPDQALRFGLPVRLGGVRNVVLGLVATPAADGRLGLSHVMVRDDASGQSVSRPLNALPHPPARWTLGGVDLDPASVSNLQRLARRADPAERPAWEAALAALQDDSFRAQASQQPGQPLRFGRPARLADGRQVVLGLVAGQAQAGGLRVHHVMYRDEATGLSVSRRPVSEAEEVAARLQVLVQAAAAHGPGSARAYQDTAELLDSWMQRTGRGRLPDVQGDTAALKQAFLAHVGPHSYPGRNADVVLAALAGGPVPAAPAPRVASMRGEMVPPDNLLGLDAATRHAIDARLGGPRVWPALQAHGLQLLGMFGRTRVLGVAMLNHAGPRLEALAGSGEKLMAGRPQGLGLKAEAVIDIARSDHGASALAALDEVGLSLMAAPPQGLGQSGDDLEAIACLQRGAHALRFLEQQGRRLLDPRTLGLSPAEIGKAARQSSGVDGLFDMIEHGEALMGHAPAGLGLASTDLANLTALQAGAKAIPTLFEDGQSVSRTLGLRGSELFETIAHDNPEAAKRALVTFGPALHAAGLPVATVAQAGTSRYGGAVLRALHDQLPGLLDGRIGLAEVTAALQAPAAGRVAAIRRL